MFKEIKDNNLPNYAKYLNKKSCFDFFETAFCNI